MRFESFSSSHNTHSFHSVCNTRNSGCDDCTVNHKQTTNRTAAQVSHYALINADKHWWTVYISTREEVRQLHQTNDVMGRGSCCWWRRHSGSQEGTQTPQASQRQSLSWGNSRKSFLTATICFLEAKLWYPWWLCPACPQKLVTPTTVVTKYCTDTDAVCTCEVFVQGHIEKYFSLNSLSAFAD